MASLAAIELPRDIGRRIGAELTLLTARRAAFAAHLVAEMKRIRSLSDAGASDEELHAALDALQERVSPEGTAIDTRIRELMAESAAAIAPATPTPASAVPATETKVAPPTASVDAACAQTLAQVRGVFVRYTGNLGLTAEDVRKDLPALSYAVIA